MINKIQNEKLEINSISDNKKYISIGIDGCKGKWVAVCLTENKFEVDKFNNIEEICEKYKNADSIVIDMPIGLPEEIKDIRLLFNNKRQLYIHG